MFSVYNKYGQLLVQSGTVDATMGYSIVLPNQSNGTFQKFVCKLDAAGHPVLVPWDTPETTPVMNTCSMVYNIDDGKYYQLICKNGSGGRPYLTLSDLGYA